MEDIKTIVEKYLRLRDRKKQLVADHKAKVEAIDNVLDSVEAHILSVFDASGIDACKTGAGTAYVSEKETASVGDWDALLTTIREQGLWHMLQKRISTDAVREFIAANNSVPPGVDWRRERTVNVRRSA